MAELCDQFFPVRLGTGVKLLNGTLPENYKPLQLPYCSSRSIDEADPELEAVVVVLSAGGDAKTSLARLQAVFAESTFKVVPSLLVAPQFFYPDHIPGFLNNLQPLDDAKNLVYWEGSADKGRHSGNHRVRPRNARVWSFTVLDQLLDHLCDARRFPKVRHITVVGHSWGGQFVHRYAAVSDFEERVAAPRGVEVHYVSVSPGSVLYMSPMRPNDDGSFGVPDGCAGYDDYHRGLDSLDYYAGGRHDPATARNVIRKRYRRRRVTYCVGENDHGSHTSCRDTVQGGGRLDIVTKYQQHLIEEFGEAVTEKHRLITVPDVDHSGGLMYASDEVRGAILDPLGQRPERFVVALWTAITAPFRRLGGIFGD